MRAGNQSEPMSHRVVASMATLVVLSALARLLWQQPEPASTTRETRIQLRWLQAARQAQTDVEPVAPQPVDRVDMPVQPPAATTTTVSRAQPAVSPPTNEKQALRIYGEDGRPDLVDDDTGLSRKGAAERVFEHRDELATQVGERATANLFSGRRAGTRQKRSERFLYGEDIQAAEARQPPDIAFNPRLHEQPSDLGSEATGDAYKAAPVRYEAAPGLKGEASRRIRAAVGMLEGRYPRCSSGQRRQWLAPALAHLEALQRVEYRYNNGADPVEAEHTLPSAADSAYDLARRALWDAERRMKACG